MAVDALVAPLLRVELFQGLKPLQITEIARQADRVVFRAGDKITEAGTSGDAAYLIVSGAAEWLYGSGVRSGDEIEIGSLIGEMAMLIEHTYGSTIVATSAVRCLKLNRDAMHQLMIEDQALAQHLTAKISARLQLIASELRSIDGDCAPESGTPEIIFERTESSEMNFSLTH